MHLYAYPTFSIINRSVIGIPLTKIQEYSNMPFLVSQTRSNDSSTECQVTGKVEIFLETIYFLAKTKDGVLDGNTETSLCNVLFMVVSQKQVRKQKH